MNMKRKLISLVLTAATTMAGLTVPAMAAEGFSDVAGSPYEEAVNSLAEQGIVSGRGDGRYSPDDGLSRAEMVSIILRAYGSREIEDIEKFEDVPPSHWAYMQIETAYQMGIIAGTGDEIFEPDADVTYEQAVKMLVCAMKKESKAKKEGGWPDGYIKVAEESEVLTGVVGSKGQTISRGAMAQLVYNGLNADSAKDYMIDWTGVSEVYNWIRDEKMRGIYDGLAVVNEDETGVLKRLENAGINTVLINLFGEPFLDIRNTYEGQIAMMDYIVERIPKYDLHYFIKINFGDNGYVGNTAMGQFHPGVLKESYFTIPCPLSEPYWDKQLIERAEIIASYPEIDGIILDFEMYSGGSSQYTSKCMCDSCWNKYITAKNLKGDWEVVEAAERNEYLKAKGKIDEYEAWAYDEIVKIFARTREAIHAVNPNMIIGYFPGYEWIPGMTEGLGTPEMPVVIASEHEYWGSLSETASRMQEIKESENMHAIYVPGLYPGQGALSPEQLEEKIMQAAPTTGGFWMYSGNTLRANEDNYQAVANANAQLDAEIKSGEFTGLPEYEVHSYTAKKIAGDKPTEEEWEAAHFTEDFVKHNTGEAIEPLTKCKVLYSDDEFFVRIYGYDDMSTVVLGDKQLHDGNPWAGDCVEFFWKFDGATDAAQLVSDLSGSLWDAYCTGIGSKNANVNFDGFSSESALFDDHWEATLTVPGTLDGVKKIKKGDVLRLEVGRYYPKGGSNICWAPTYGSYLGSSSLWGFVTLG